MVRTRSQSGGIVPRERCENVFIAASPAPLHETAELFVEETWNYSHTIHRALLLGESLPPAGRERGSGSHNAASFEHLPHRPRIVQ